MATMALKAKHGHKLSNEGTNGHKLITLLRKCWALRAAAVLAAAMWNGDSLDGVSLADCDRAGR